MTTVDCRGEADYYRGEPAARLVEREQKPAQALGARGQYRQACGDVEEPQNLSPK